LTVSRRGWQDSRLVDGDDSATVELPSDNDEGEPRGSPSDSLC
jgi:hypothetical protein